MPSSEPTEQLSEVEIFQAAWELPEEDRAGYLETACAGRPDLRADVERLLASLADNAFMRQALDSRHPEAELTRLKPEEEGGTIGPYKLLQQIGEGGFGTVWMAEQESPIRRRVAFKIIKLGMDTREVVARFEQERQALAIMDHPNIARVFDAGSTQFGRPYFVMELVRGVRITDYCDQAKLPTEARLQLFIAVCHAIQHAHQKGVIHRDLKPSNILVTLHDGVPVPKVIDFGVAKATQPQRLTDLTLFTKFEQMIGTPLYMSPEQAEMSGLDVDTRSDIYSLGVLLYELLTGRTPFDPEKLMQAGLDEMRRAIREEEPQKPSTYVSTMAADVQTAVAQHRQTDSAKLLGQIRGDLDWIVMKALEKDRNRRYETANGLAQDIQRHLGNEPVEACPPSAGYRFRRMVRRNRVAFAATSAVAAVLIIGLGISTWMYWKEKEARERAVAAEKAQKQENIKSHQVAQFLQDMLEGVAPSVALGRDTTMLREILDKTAERVGQDLKDQPEVEAELRSLIGKVFSALADQNKAEVMHRKAFEIRKALHGEQHLDVAESLHDLARVVHGDEGDAMFRQALAIRRKLLGEEHSAVAECMTSLAFNLRSQSRYTDAENMARKALAMNRKLLGNDHPAVASSLLALSQAVGWQGRAEESESIHREVLAILRKHVGDDHPDVGVSHFNLAQALSDQGKLSESETTACEAVAIFRKVYGNEHLVTDAALYYLGDILRKQEKLAEAELLFRECLAHRIKRLGNDHPEVDAVRHKLAVVLLGKGEPAEAEAFLRESLTDRIKRYGDNHREVAVCLANIGSALCDQGKPAEGETFLREGVAIMRKLFGNEHRDLASCLRNLGLALSSQNKWSEAEAAIREALVIYTKEFGPEHPDVENTMTDLMKVLHHFAHALAKEGDLPEAEKKFREALEFERQQVNGFAAEGKSAFHCFTKFLEEIGQREEAEILRSEAFELARKAASNNPKGSEELLSDIAEDLYRQNKPDRAEPFYRLNAESRSKRLPADDNATLLGTSSLARALADWAWNDRPQEVSSPREKPKDATGSEGIATRTPAERAEEAEKLLRECLAIRSRGNIGQAWHVDSVKNRLGGALVAVAVTDRALTPESREAKLIEAEALLLASHEAMLGGSVDKKYLRDSLIRLVRLYEAWEQPQKGAEWQKKLDDLDQAEAEKADAKRVSPSKQSDH